MTRRKLNKLETGIGYYMEKLFLIDLKIRTIRIAFL